MKNIHIENDSGDRKYFTIIPNYILNHSTLWDREVYIQMKRITGEDGTCWTSRNTLAKQCGISLDRLKKSIKYLVEHKWIVFLGKKSVITKGGVQEVNEYRVADLWDTNNTFYREKYQGGSSESTPILKGGSSNPQRGVVDASKGGSSESHKEEPYINKIPIKEEHVSFEEFWIIYPKKVGKPNTIKLWEKLTFEEQSKIMVDIPLRKKDSKWVGGFIKDPERYIKTRQWEDDIIPEKSKIKVFQNTNQSDMVDKLKGNVLS
jgi:hypothetical protein